jgi:4-hydroxybenzoate polyprenyltransferase
MSFGLLFGALYPLTQIYQLDEDRRRGDRTLTVVLGLDRSLGLAIVMAGLSFAGFALAAAKSGWSHGMGGVARWAALAAAAGAWLVVLGLWWRRRHAMDSAAHQAGMHHALAAWAITDMAVLFGWAR